MNIGANRISPRLVKRRCGGWLAASEAAAPLKIGVTAETEEMARQAFDKAIKEWEQILMTKRSDA